MSRKKRDIKLNKRNIIIFGVLFVLLGLSIFFSQFLTYLFKLRPNIEEVTGLEVHFLDVGEGDAILVRLPNNETMIIDSGTKAYESKVNTYIDHVFF